MPIRNRRTTDATKLSFPLQFVIVIVGAAGAIWASQYGLRSDVRDIRTRMEMQSKVDEQQAKMDEERATATRESLSDMKRRIELQAYEIQELKINMLKIGAKP